ncbi:hypothetical protein AWM70_03225 [Paenibacillus yonginensis]|uniref:Uncharacterized protein n=1 Tax=Paenibacillus yonginensis TaxID=1462996 RepID=A0A1B1MX11_9BACL|nr:hypothetical protein [Paenibacillus yonginensis]ANS73706.1 hypothetical protein AWM70_03225 [Paenibacillus yonginensis]
MPGFKQKEFVSQSGQTYLFQHPGVRAVSKINDAAKNKFGVVSEERLSEEILKYVVVEPKRKIDDFDDYREYSEVVNAAYLFISGQEGERDDPSEGSRAEG